MLRKRRSRRGRRNTRYHQQNKANRLTMPLYLPLPLLRPARCHLPRRRIHCNSKGHPKWPYHVCVAIVMGTQSPRLIAVTITGLPMPASRAGTERPNVAESVLNASIVKISSCNVYMWMESEIGQESLYLELLNTAFKADGI